MLFFVVAEVAVAVVAEVAKEKLNEKNKTTEQISNAQIIFFITEMDLTIFPYLPNELRQKRVSILPNGHHLIRQSKSFK